jgi:TRAP-type transport system small permease protein
VETLKRALEAINAFVLLVMFLLVMVTIVFRNILQIPASWSQELSEYIFVFLVFIGSAAAMKEERHIGIDVITLIVSSNVQRILRIVARLLMIPFVYILVVGSIANIQATWNNYLPTVTWFRIGIIYLVVFVGGAIMLFYLLANLVLDIMGKFTPVTLAEEVKTEGDVT